MTANTRIAGVRCTYAKIFADAELKQCVFSFDKYASQSAYAISTGETALIQTEDYSDGAIYTLTAGGKDYLMRLFKSYGWEYTASGEVVETDNWKTLYSMWKEFLFQWETRGSIDNNVASFIGRFYGVKEQYFAEDYRYWVRRFYMAMTHKGGYIRRHEKIHALVKRLSPYVVGDKGFYIESRAWNIEYAMGFEDRLVADYVTTEEELKEKVIAEAKKQETNKLLLMLAGIVSFIN